MQAHLKLVDLENWAHNIFGAHKQWLLSIICCVKSDATLLVCSLKKSMLIILMLWKQWKQTKAWWQMKMTKLSFGPERLVSRIQVHVIKNELEYLSELITCHTCECKRMTSTLDAARHDANSSSKALVSCCKFYGLFMEMSNATQFELSTPLLETWNKKL